MPTSSTSRQSRLGGVLNNKRHLISSTTFWSPNNNNNNNHKQQHQPDETRAPSTAAQTRAPAPPRSTTFQQSKNKLKKKSSGRIILTSVAKDQLERADKRLETKHISSSANHSIMTASADQSVGAFSLQTDQTKQPSALSLAGQLVLTGASKQPNSLGSQSIEQAMGASYSSSQNGNRMATNRGQLGAHVNKAYLASNPGLSYTSKAAIQQSQSSSQVSINASGSQQLTASSTARLDQLAGDTRALSKSAPSDSRSTFTVRRHVNLKYIKTIIILLLAVDLIITVFVHQFSSNDQLTILWFTSFKMRFSLLNLILSSIWFIILIGAILFDVHFILAISCLVHSVSFFVLLGFSVVHFSRRIDYNTVHLFSLLTLLFSIIVLHVYLLVLASLTYYLMRAVRSRRKSSLGR